MKITKYIDIITFILAWVLIVLSVLTEQWLAAIFWLLLAHTVEKAWGPKSYPLPKTYNRYRSVVDKVRDSIGYLIVRVGLHICSVSYRSKIAGAIEYGLSAAIRDENEGREAPESWRHVTLTGVVRPPSEDKLAKSSR